MNDPLQILHLEDDPDYAAFVRDTLEGNGMPAKVVHAGTRQEFESALDGGTYDLILADYSLPNYTGFQALQAARKKTPATPFVLLSGTIGEKAAIDSIHAGATDYVLKHWPERLLPAIRRAVEEARERQRRLRAEQELARREKYLRALTEHSLDVLTILDRRGRVRYSSPSLTRALGYDAGDFEAQDFFLSVHPEDVDRARETFRRSCDEPGTTSTLEFRFRHHNGSWVHLESVVQSCLNDPDIEGVIVNSRDVTERKRAEMELCESERQYRILFQDNPDPVWVFDPETHQIVEVNDVAVSNYGYAREEFLKLKATELRPAQDIPAFLEFTAKLPRSPDSQSLGWAGVWRHRRKDGEIMVVEVKWATVLFQKRPGILTVAHDITRRVHAERRDTALARLGRQLNSATTQLEATCIIRDITDELFGWDAFTLFLCDLEKRRMTQVMVVDTVEGNRVEMPHDPALEVVSPRTERVLSHGAELVLQDDPNAPESDSTGIGDTTRRSASVMVVPVHSGAKVIGVISVESHTPRAYEKQQLGLLQIFADHCGGALERIRAERASRESEQQFHDLFEGSPDAIFVEDEEGNVLDVNPAGCKLHAMSRDELVGKNVLDLVPPDRRRGAREGFERMVRGEISRAEGESWAVTGAVTPVEVRAGKINFAGRPAMLLHVRDLSERRHAETALRSSELLFYSVWENSVDGMRLTDEHGRIMAVNDAFCRQVGMERVQLEGQLFTVMLSDASQAATLMAAYRERFPERRVAAATECRFPLRTGNTVVLQQADSFVELRGQPPLMLALFRDITEQTRLEEQLRQSQKMEAIGQLAGGVAHDFNNILTVIHGHASLLTSAGGLQPIAAKSAQQIALAAERAAGLTRQLLTFSRRQVMQPRQLDFNEVVSNMTAMLARILGEDISLQVQYCRQSAHVMADQSMMEQVLLNLAVNARDAMPKGGELTISIGSEEVDARHAANHHGARAGRFLCLSVADTGNGIAPENLSRIFEPFFTTKAKGKGTGLGLATVYGVVNQHQGWIEVNSRLDQGTNFRVFIPLTDAQEVLLHSPPAAATPRGGTETILLVEDEEAVREMVGHLLKNQGYRVVEAESGVRALDVWEEQGRAVDLLLTDLVMPGGVNGRELAERLRGQSPKLKVIYMSGYSADILGKEFVVRPGVNFLQKPYDSSKLAHTVRKCLDVAVEA